MAMHNEFVRYLLELLEPFAPVKAKAMFGGYGIYRHGLMFGLVDNDALFLKADDTTRKAFQSRELKPFTYKRQGQDIALTYYEAPAEAVDNAEELCTWAQMAYDAAVRAARSNLKKKQGT